MQPAQKSGRPYEPVVKQPDGSDKGIIIIRKNLDCHLKKMKSVMQSHVLEQNIPMTELQDLYLKGHTAVQQVIDDGDLPEDDKILLEVKCWLIGYNDVHSKHQETV